MTTHLWHIASNKESLWVRWIHVHRFRDRTIWNVVSTQNMSWGWRKLLQLRDIVRPFIWTNIGNGTSTSIWYDRWCDLSPLIQFLTPRDISREGFTLQSKVADLITNGMWMWPQRWLLKAPNIQNIPVPFLSQQNDTLRWRDQTGKLTSFTVHGAWVVLRARSMEVTWHGMVWFSHCIPRHAFQLWLIMRRALKTQDKLRPWDVDPNLDLSRLKCSLCETHKETHEHLFFGCDYSTKVWCFVRPLAGMDLVAPSISDIEDHFQPLTRSRKASAVIGKLLVAAVAYFIWIERNNRIFNKVKRKPEEICDDIIVTVRLKLLSFRFKNTRSVEDLLKKWKMPKNFRVYG